MCIIGLLQPQSTTNHLTDINISLPDNIITVKGKIERIVSESLWDSVQPKKNLSGKTNKGKYLLSGLVKCPICHNSYHVDTKGNVQYLRHNKNKTDKCINSIPMDNVKEKVILKVINKIFSKYNVEYFTNNFDTISQTQTASIEQHIKKLKFKINALKVKYDNLLNTLSETTDENIKASITDKLTSINTETLIPLKSSKFYTSTAYKRHFENKQEKTQSLSDKS